MGAAETLLFAFLAGLTVTGLAASAMEFMALRCVSFGEPFVTPKRILRSLAATAAAGPFMLLNDALTARRAGRISALALLSCAFAASAWALAHGVIVVSLASYLIRPLT